MSVLASPEYWSCEACGGSEFWMLCDGQLMCANWPDCGACPGRWASASDAAEYGADRKAEYGDSAPAAAGGTG